MQDGASALKKRYAAAGFRWRANIYCRYPPSGRIVVNDNSQHIVSNRPWVDAAVEVVLCEFSSASYECAVAA
jgi:hypothetical protein